MIRLFFRGKLPFSVKQEASGVKGFGNRSRSEKAAVKNEIEPESLRAWLELEIMEL